MTDFANFVQTYCGKSGSRVYVKQYSFDVPSTEKMRFEFGIQGKLFTKGVE